MNPKGALESAFHHLGCTRWIRHRHARSLRILMYHRFHGALDNFREQCAHIARCYMPVSLNQVARARREGDPFPANALAITVDDGYYDFARVFPIFREFGLPVTLFAVTGFLDRELWLWPDETNLLFTETPLNSVEIAGHLYNLATPHTRIQSRDEVNQRLIEMTNRDRLQIALKRRAGRGAALSTGVAQQPMRFEQEARESGTHPRLLNGSDAPAA